MTFDIADGLTDATLMVFAAVWESFITNEEVIITVFDDTTKDIVDGMLEDIQQDFPDAYVSCEREYIH